MKTAALAVFLLLSSCAARAGEVSFTTTDKCVISASYRAPAAGGYVFINLHGMGSTRGEWGPFEAVLKKSGYGYLSLDLRGHGKSLKCGGKKADYSVFTAGDWAAASLDVSAARAFLLKKGVREAEMVFCGASVGSSLVLKAVAEGKFRPAGLVLLSPGLEYAGITAADYLPAASPPLVALAASPEDIYAWKSAAYITARLESAGVKTRFFPGAGGHGVNMFSGPGAPLMGKLPALFPFPRSQKPSALGGRPLK